MIKGLMYYLDEVLQREGEESHYLLVADGDAGYEISFGRNRKLNVSSECFIVSIDTEDKYTLEKIEFDGGICDYLKVLKDKHIPYTIPKSLPASIDKLYSRFECAVGDTWWAGRIHGFFGTNGYAITDVGYIGDDRYESYEICFCLNPESFHIGEHAVKTMSGAEIPKDFFIEKLLEEVVYVEEGAPLIDFLLKEAGICGHIEHIQFMFNNEK